MGNGLYSASRSNGFPTIYGENKQPVTVDVLIIGLLFAFVIIIFSFLVILPGFRGSQKLPTLCRFVTSMLIGASILICNFGQEWEVGGEVKAETQYKAFIGEEIHAKIKVKIGLRSVNITLVGDPIHQLGERIQYNERFTWEWAQGRLGFGPQAGRINREFRAAQWKGLPYPILWIAEYFTLDGEGIRFGRHYRTAGWYCHVMMWTAFSLWALSNILFFMVIRYGAYFICLTGTCLILSNILFASIRNFIPLEIPIGSLGLEVIKITFKFGWSFWITLITGIICLIIGVVILFLDLRNPDLISTFFGINVLQDYEDFYVTPAEVGTKPLAGEAIVSEAPESQPEEIYGMKKRTIAPRYQRATLRRPTPPPRYIITEELPVYENLATGRFDTIDEEEITIGGSADNIALQFMNH